MSPRLRIGRSILPLKPTLDLFGPPTRYLHVCTGRAIGFLRTNSCKLLFRLVFAVLGTKMLLKIANSPRFRQILGWFAGWSGTASRFRWPLYAATLQEIRVSA
jgi:hypothetical protein